MPDEQMPSAYGDPRTPWQPPEDPTQAASGGAGWPLGSPWPSQDGSPSQGGWPPPAGQGGWAQPPSQGGPPPASQVGWPQPPQAGWTPPPQVRSRRRAVVTGAIVALAAALVAGSGGYELGLQHSRINAVAANLNAVGSGVCPAGSAATGLSATSPAATALLARLLPVPQGDKQVTILKQGVLSLSDYMQQLYSKNSSEKARLVARCFQAAVHRTWETPGGTTVSVWLIQFGSNADARSYTLATEQGDADTMPASTARFTVPGVADSKGFADATLDQDGNTFTRVLGDAGNTSIIIHLFIPAKIDNAASSQVLQAQSARLSAGSA
jgi:hypothetical protein